MAKKKEKKKTNKRSTSARKGGSRGGGASRVSEKKTYVKPTKSRAASKSGDRTGAGR